MELNNWFSKAQRMAEKASSMWSAYEQQRDQFIKWEKEGHISKEECTALIKKANSEYYSKAQDIMGFHEPTEDSEQEDVS